MRRVREHVDGDHRRHAVGGAGPRAQEADEVAAERVASRKFDAFWKQEEAWIRKGIEARRTRDMGRVRRLEALRGERAKRRERLGNVKLALAAGERSGKLVAELKQVTKRFGDRVVVRDIDLTVMRGDRLGILGPNGAGKSTLLKLLLGELAPDAGTVRVDGQDLWPQVLAGFLARIRANPDDTVWDSRTVEVLGMIPNDYLQYYYYTARQIARQDRWPPSRAEQVMAIEERLLAQYADPGRSELPPDLLQRGGAYYSTVAAQLLNAHYNDLGERHVLNVPHRGAVPGWPDDWVLEMPCLVDASGIRPLPAAPLSPACFGLLAHVKAFELLTVEAAVAGDRDAAYRALLAHPLGPSADRVQAVLDDLLQTNRAYLPQFWP